MNHILGSVKVLNEVPVEPVSLTEAKAWLNYKQDDQNDTILDLIRTARRVLENHTSLSFVTKDIRVLMEINDPWMEVPNGPLQSVTSMTVIYGVGSSTVLTDNADYELVGGLVRMNVTGQTMVVAKVGYTDLPKDLKTDILKLVAWYFQNRGIKFNAEDKLKRSPEWQALAAHYYAKVVI
jgi:hypothetical protein